MSKIKIRNKSNSRINALFLSFCLLLFCHLGFVTCLSLLFAQEENNSGTGFNAAVLTKQIRAAKTNEGLSFILEDLAGLYFAENKYNEFIEFLQALIKQKPALEPVVDCYIAFTRYYQLKYLEVKQNWDEYFGQGNTYRSEIIRRLSKKTLENLPSADSFLCVHAKLILWKVYRDQDGSFDETALLDLIDSTLIYAKSQSHYSEPIKTVADQLLLYGEKIYAYQIYKAYLAKILVSPISSDDLKNLGLSFYNQGNLSLAETIFDVYVEKVQNDEKLADLVEIAMLFSYNDTGVYDLIYAEKIFKTIEERGGKLVFDQELFLGQQDIWSEDLLYLRAFNLEKARQYHLSKDFYRELTRRYPLSRHSDEAVLKIGVIYSYILGDINSGKNYFEKLTQSQMNIPWNPSEKTDEKSKNVSPQVISGLYQLGLIAQWQGDFAKAKNYYDKLIETAKDEYREILALVEQRLQEIEEEKPLEYSLKKFLDICFKTDAFDSNWEKVNLKSAPCRVKKDSEVNISSVCQVAETGCFNVELEYLWSADTGITKPVNQQASFATQYTEPGTKIVYLLVVSSTGIIGWDLSFIDVTP